MRKTFHKQLNAIIEDVISMRSLSRQAVNIGERVIYFLSI